MRRLPPLPALPAFEATARLGSMTAAAAELGRTHSAVSKQIAHLEDALGVELFEPEGVGVRPTVEGAAYARAVGDALDALAGATARVVRAAAGPGLTVRCSGALAARWLIPRLPAFQALRPDVDLRLAVAAGGLGFGRDADPHDILLSWDRLTTPVADLLAQAGAGARVHVLGDAAFGPVASPRLPILRDADGGVRLAMIDHAEAEALWPRWQALAGLRVTPTSRARYPNTLLCIEAAAAGLGAVVVERRLVARELEAGVLAAPFGFLPWPGGLVAVRRGPPGRAAAAFLAWLAAEGGAVSPAAAAAPPPAAPPP